jgi:dolichol-phosphate mannosyltransferase
VDRKTLVIVPTYNEEKNLRRIIAAVHDHVPNAHVLVVDDASPDGTGRVADGISRIDERVFVLHRQGKLGLGSAYIQGFQWGLSRGYDVFVEMDADFSHPPERLPALLAALYRHDVAVGSRYVSGGGCENWPLNRLLLSRFASAYTQLITGLPVRDPTAGYVAYRREVLEALDLESLEAGGYAFQIEMKYAAWRSGFSLVELPIVFRDRDEGTSKMSHGIIFEAAWLVVRLALFGTPGNRVR